MISRQNAAPDGFVRRRALLLILYTRQTFCRTGLKNYVFLINLSDHTAAPAADRQSKET